MINAGALVVTGFIKGHSPKDRLDYLLGFISIQVHDLFYIAFKNVILLHVITHGPINHG
jgi:glutaminase